VAALVCSLLDEGKVVLAVSLSEGLRKATQLKAGDLVRQLAPLVGGGGGGRPDMATAGGKDASGLDELEAAFRSAIQAGSGT
jgi:alanyl-tRNA synthetase